MMSVNVCQNSDIKDQLCPIDYTDRKFRFDLLVCQTFEHFYPCTDT